VQLIMPLKPNQWNKLHQLSIDVPSINAFKSALLKIHGLVC